MSRWEHPCGLIRWCCIRAHCKCNILLDFCISCRCLTNSLVQHFCLQNNEEIWLATSGKSFGNSYSYLFCEWSTGRLHCTKDKQLGLDSLLLWYSLTSDHPNKCDKLDVHADRPEIIIFRSKFQFQSISVDEWKDGLMHSPEHYKDHSGHDKFRISHCRCTLLLLLRPFRQRIRVMWMFLKSNGKNAVNTISAIDSFFRWALTNNSRVTSFNLRRFTILRWK